jgi:hypothetical protein
MLIPFNRPDFDTGNPKRDLWTVLLYLAFLLAVIACIVYMALS